MSDIEQHVVSLETAKRMKELGFNQKDGIFVWWAHPDEDLRTYKEVWSTDTESYSYKDEDMAAPILSEILEALPPYLKYNEDFDEDGYADDFYELVLKFDGASTYARYETRRDGYMHPACTCTNHPAEAAALLWCKLVEEGILSSNEKE